MTELSCDEFDFWIDHYQDTPFRHQLTDYYGSSICAAIYNATGQWKTVNPDRFIPKIQREQTPEEQMAVWDFLGCKEAQ